MNCVCVLSRSIKRDGAFGRVGVSQKGISCDATAGVDGNLIMAGAMLVNIIDDFETTAPPPGPVFAT